jgi:hypothetical protein
MVKGFLPIHIVHNGHPKNDFLSISHEMANNWLRGEPDLVIRKLCACL